MSRNRCYSCLVAIVLTCNLPLTHAQQRGWVNEVMPNGMSLGQLHGEYLWAKTGEIMIFVPAGPSQSIVFGSDAQGRPFVHPEYVSLAGFYIGKNDVTIATFRKFAVATGYKTEAEQIGKATIPSPPKGYEEKQGSSWASPGFPQTDQNPAVLLTWNDAKAYCDWAGGRLPTRDEWLKAALWDDDSLRLRILPWGLPGIMAPYLPGVPAPPQYADAKKGNFFDAAYYRAMSIAVPPGVQVVDDGYGFTSPVGNYPAGVSFYGVNDAAGNVSDWTSDLITPAMQLFSNHMLGDGYVAMGSNFLSPATFPAYLPITYRALPGGLICIGVRLVIPAV